MKISCVSNIKFLGIEFDENLNWKQHILSVEKKLASAIGVIGRIRYKLNNYTALLLYDSLILSQLSYCTFIWSSTYKSALRKIYLLQKRALKICTLSVKHKGINLFTKFHKLTIYDLNLLQIAKFVYKSVNDMSPYSSIHHFQEVAAIHHHNTRMNKKLFSKNFKTNIRKFSLSIQGPILWNSIPDHIQHAFSLNKFSSLCKQFLQNGCFSSSSALLYSTS